jgi:hypothetical protein
VDLNADGREDLVSGSWPSKLYYFLATEEGWAEPALLLDPLGDPLEYGQATNIAPIDWDGDGDMDLVGGEFWGGLFVLENRGGEGVARFVQLNDKSIRVEGFDLAGLGSHTGVTTSDWDGDGRTDVLLGTGEGAVYWLRDEATEGPVKLGFPRMLLAPRAKVNKDDRSYTDHVGGRLKLAVTDWDGDGLQDLLVGDSQSQRGYLAKDSLGKKKQAAFDEMNERYLKLGEAFDAACEERTFWGRGWHDKAKADEAQARVSACFDEMEPLIDELEELSSEEDAKGEPEGVVWVMLRKQPKPETDSKTKR